MNLTATRRSTMTIPDTGSKKLSPAQNTTRRRMMGRSSLPTIRLDYQRILSEMSIQAVQVVVDLRKDIDGLGSTGRISGQVPASSAIQVD